ncbi:MAG: type II secretion system protein [Verrucomicrobia bacterium]|nr:type II secretion system protein [Verrucomicrobiota bacterium]
MHNLFQRIRKLKANSFTLVELLVVISIIGLLAALLVMPTTTMEIITARTPLLSNLPPFSPTSSP